jgi:predicted RNase H-like nuclease (RuvC/YqgF family)
VASRAGVTAGLIHNTYPEIAGKIRAASSRSRLNPPKRSDELSKLKAANKHLMTELSTAKKDIAKLASQLATLKETLKDSAAGAAKRVVHLRAAKR